MFPNYHYLSRILHHIFGMCPKGIMCVTMRRKIRTIRDTGDREIDLLPSVRHRPIETIIILLHPQLKLFLIREGLE